MKTIVDAKGNFHNQAYYKDSFVVNEQEVYDEWKAQIKTVLAADIQPTHLDAHHHANLFGIFNEIYLKLANEYNLPVRNNFNNQDSTRKTTDGFVYTMDTALQSKESIEKLFELQDSVEIMCHPAFLDQFLLANSSYTIPRTEELDLLTNQSTKELFYDQEMVELITFKQL